MAEFRPYVVGMGRKESSAFASNAVLQLFGDYPLASEQSSVPLCGSGWSTTEYAILLTGKDDGDEFIFPNGVARASMHHAVDQ